MNETIPKVIRRRVYVKSSYCELKVMPEQTSIKQAAHRKGLISQTQALYFSLPFLAAHGR